MTADLSMIDLRTAQAHLRTSMHALNNRFAAETSYLESADWDRLLDMSCVARLCVEGDRAAGFLIALDPNADYDSVNYQWFKARERRFIYIDRVVVHEDHHRKGVASRLYADLIEIAQAAGMDIVCEVNQDPPNPASDAFHARLGFKKVGRERLASGKTVSYLKLAI